METSPGEEKTSPGEEKTSPGEICIENRCKNGSIFTQFWMEISPGEGKNFSWRRKNFSGRRFSLKKQDPKRWPKKKNKKISGPKNSR